MLVFSLFVLLIGASFFGYCYMASKINSQHKQILILSKQNYELKTKLNKQITNTGNILIKYKSPGGTSGTITEDCFLYISPMEDSAQLNKLSKSTQVEVVDSAEIFGMLWYEVALQKTDKINHKGWIKSKVINVEVQSNMYNI